jgi:hypothetical protein
MVLYSHFPIGLHGVVLTYLDKQRDKFTFPYNGSGSVFASKIKVVSMLTCHTQAYDEHEWSSSPAASSP